MFVGGLGHEEWGAGELDNKNDLGYSGLQKRFLALNNFCFQKKFGKYINESSITCLGLSYILVGL